MVLLSSRKAVPMVLLSILAPISLLVAFRLSGVLREPFASERFTVDEIMWEMERPSEYTRIEKVIESAYTDYLISIDSSVSVHEYFENGLARPYNDRDGLSFEVNVNATAIGGFIESIAIAFYRDTDSIVYAAQKFSSYQNVILTHIKGLSSDTDIKYIGAKVTKSPCSVMVPAHWVFTDQGLENHRLEVDIEVTFSDGEKNDQRIVMPIILKTVFSHD